MDSITPYTFSLPKRHWTQDKIYLSIENTFQDQWWHNNEASQSEKCSVPGKFRQKRKFSENFLLTLKLNFQVNFQTYLLVSNVNTEFNIFRYCNNLWNFLQDFEQVVLETALENVVAKFSRHLEIIKPALEMLLQQVIVCLSNTENLKNILPRLKQIRRQMVWGDCSRLRKV